MLKFYFFVKKTRYSVNRQFLPFADIKQKFTMLLFIALSWRIAAI
jgi:hypothetical protein